MTSYKQNVSSEATPWQQIAAAATGAAVTSVLVTPLDVVKTRLQTQEKQLVRSKCYLYCNGLMDHICQCDSTSLNNGKLKFNGTMDAFIKITKTEGIRSLWSGLSPTLVLAIPATVIYFVSYEQLRLAFRRHLNANRPLGEPPLQPAWVPLVAGSTARLVCAAVVSPLEMTRTKMQSQKLSYMQVGRGLKVLVSQAGWLGLWRGSVPTLLRDVPFSAIYWSTYEGIKRHFKQETPTFMLSFCAGAAAGMLAATATAPFDVIKTHQQIEFGEKTLYGDTPKQNVTPMRDIVSHVYKQSGIRGLYSGLVPRLIKIAPSCAIMISIFEHGKVFFSRLGKSELLTTQQPVQAS